jgi:hypothetical protein
MQLYAAYHHHLLSPLQESGTSAPSAQRHIFGLSIFFGPLDFSQVMGLFLSVFVRF